jgi:hypothetical protein
VQSAEGREQTREHRVKSTEQTAKSRNRDGSAEIRDQRDSIYY